jgi:diguanylate cyclase (GGDEF)-like protein
MPPPFPLPGGRGICTMPGMAEPLRTMLLPLAALCLASTASAALALLDQGLPAYAAILLCLAWVGAGWTHLGPAAVLIAAPALALGPLGGWSALASWSIAGFAGVLVLRQSAVPDPERLRELRAELRDAEHERTLLHRHIQRYPNLLEACLELSAARELDQFASVLCQRARELLPETREVLVYLGTASDPQCRAALDQDGRPCPRPAGEDERYVAAEARSLTRRDGNHVRVLVPLRGDRRQEADAVRGVLVVDMVMGDVGDRLSLELLGALGRLGGLGLAAVDLVNQARGLALRDDLTGLFGQYEFLRRLDEQAAACRRHGTSLGVLMCDMDHLKAFNDRHGHLAGDAALRAVATEMTKTLPNDAILCRYGGEEFAALITGRTPERLAAIAEALREAIAHARPDPVDPGKQVTASLGVAVMGGKESVRDALKRADAACYAAKAQGRNRVVMAP